MNKLPKESVSKQIVQARVDIHTEHGLSWADRCPTCMKPAAEPYRRELGGVIVEGCVDAHHTAALEEVGGEVHRLGTAAWHFRPEGVAIRQSWLDMLQGRDYRGGRRSRR